MPQHIFFFIFNLLNNWIFKRHALIRQTKQINFVYSDWKLTSAFVT